MKKKILMIVLIFMMGFGIYQGRYFPSSSNELSNLTNISEVEALADDESWWGRLDYVCVDVSCQCIFYSYKSNVADRVADGHGTVAHTWNCTGCGDCGWIVL